MQPYMVPGAPDRAVFCVHQGFQLQSRQQRRTRNEARRSRAGVGRARASLNKRRADRWGTGPSIQRRASAAAASSEGSASNTEASSGDSEDVTNKIRLATAGGLVIVAVVACFMRREWIFDALKAFTETIPAMGPKGYCVFSAVYMLLDIFMIPVLPLALAAGAMFGIVEGSLLCCSAGTLSAVIAFLIARYGARKWVTQYTDHNQNFKAIDRMIGEDSFRVIVLLRITPLLPISLINYLYGLTSVRLLPYTLATWIGYLPGTFGLVSTGALGQAMQQGAGPPWWHVGLAVSAYIFTMSYVANLAKSAMDRINREESETTADSTDDEVFMDGDGV
eukprot:CAMPEP_0198225100 /NCGR_PEP_ID=MMETSP1445-20131203/99656_1 /TAXON_ID=36898 /ORGANISM="Pyramimonas sp., Strain CCMP2087" /LENGTH=334 /DNA_ID=CAMNT_0043904499 /DNA_START=295 /DNA_END=1299 /DNA_ORIENTATION=-